MARNEPLGPGPTGFGSWIPDGNKVLFLPSKLKLLGRHRVAVSYRNLIIYIFKLEKSIKNALYPTLHPQVQQFKFTSLRFYQNFMNLRFKSPSHEL